MNLSLSGVFLISMIGFCQADMLTILAKLGEYLRAPKPLPLHYNATLESKVTLAKRIAQIKHILEDWMRCQPIMNVR